MRSPFSRCTLTKSAELAHCSTLEQHSHFEASARTAPLGRKRMSRYELALTQKRPRGAALLSELSSQRTDSLFTRPTASECVADSDVHAGAALSLSQMTGGPTTKAQHSQAPVQHLGVGEGGLFFGLLDGGGGQQPIAAQQQGQAVGGGDPSSLRAAALAHPTPSELKRMRDRRKELLPLPADGSNKVDRFRVISRLGVGGLSTVFLAEDMRTRCHVALKLSTKPLKVIAEDDDPTCIKDESFRRALHRDSWDYRCFCRENETYSLLKCSDPAIQKCGLPQLHGSGLVLLDGYRVHSYLAMSLLGESVYDEIRAGRTRDRAYLCQLAHAMLRSLEHIHRSGYVHRDIKPGNFCLPPDAAEGACHAYIIDFGFVMPMPKAPVLPPMPSAQHFALPSNSSSPLHVGARSGYSSLKQAFEGTPDYASLNALNSRAQGPADDLESLAYTLLEMWLGDLPWDVPNVQLWPLDVYTEAVSKLFPPSEVARLIRQPPHMRKPLRWDDHTLAIMGRLRRQEWIAAIATGAVPRFLRLWVTLVRRFKPWQVPQPALYQQLHELINSGLACDAEDEGDETSKEQQEEEAGVAIGTQLMAVEDSGNGLSRLALAQPLHDAMNWEDGQLLASPPQEQQRQAKRARLMSAGGQARQPEV